MTLVFQSLAGIDPLDPTSTPEKRRAMGRFHHENTAATLTLEARVVVYMGDACVYKFTSKKTHN